MSSSMYIPYVAPVYVAPGTAMRSSRLGVHTVWSSRFISNTAPNMYHTLCSARILDFNFRDNVVGAASQGHEAIEFLNHHIATDVLAAGESHATNQHPPAAAAEVHQFRRCV